MFIWSSGLLCSTLVLLLCGHVAADQNETDTTDIILSYRPSLSYSLPLQVLLFTIICTIILVLCVHLAFTSSTHWSLSPSSFSLQLSASVFFLSTHGAILIMVLKIASRQTLKWPYMFSWVAVEIPPQIPPVWSRARVITWCVARTISSALVQASHVHLLTLLYPSRFESLLLHCTLGPLVVVCAVTQFLPLIPPAHPDYIHVTYAIRMTCTASLAILFSSLLLVWSTPFFNSSPPEDDVVPTSTPSTKPHPPVSSAVSSPHSKPLHPLAHLFLSSTPLPRARSLTKLFSSRAWSRHSGTLTLALSTLSLSLFNIILSLACLVHAAHPTAIRGSTIVNDEGGLTVTMVREAPWQLAMIWAITLWQSYLGWWWWICAGGDVDGSGSDGREQKERNIGLGGIQGAKVQLGKLGRRIRRRKDVGKAKAVVNKEMAGEEQTYREAMLDSPKILAAGSTFIPSPSRTSNPASSTAPMGK